MEAHAELLWVRREAASFRETARHYKRAARDAERDAAERDDRVRERLRKLGLWRLITKLGLDVRVSEPSMCAMRAWLSAARRRARADGRAPPLFFSEGVLASGGARAKGYAGYTSRDAETKHVFQLET
jgi:hypothetical protein